MPRILEIDQITYCGDGSIGLKLMKKIIVDNEVVFSEPHRVTVMPDQTVEEVMEMVNASIQRDLGYEPLPSEQVKHADAVRDLVLTSPAVQARKSAWLEEKAVMIAKQEAELEAVLAAEISAQETKS